MNVEVGEDWKRIIKLDPQINLHKIFQHKTLCQLCYNNLMETKSIDIDKALSKGWIPVTVSGVDVLQRHHLNIRAGEWIKIGAKWWLIDEKFHELV